MSGTKQIYMLPPSVIELQKELSLYHPTLCRVLKLLDDEADRLGAIAVHCNVKLDGEYTAEQIAYVCDQLLPRLVELREVTGPR